MTINRHNYEEFFLLYIDNELSPAERTMVEDFLSENPDLKGELQMFRDAVLQPEPPVSLPGKENLLRGENGLHINDANCEAYFIQYADNELDVATQAKVEDFVYHHPEHQASFELYQQIKMTPDNLVVFPHKESLYRRTGGDRVIVMRWWRMAAAAAVIILVGGYTWYVTSAREPGNSGMANNGQSVGTPLSPDTSTDDPAAVRPDAPGPQQNLALNETSPAAGSDDPLAAAHEAASRSLQHDPAAKNRQLAVNRQAEPAADPAFASEAQTDSEKNLPAAGNLKSASNVTRIETGVTQVDVPKASPNELEKASPSANWNVSFDELDKNDKQPEARYASNETGEGNNASASESKSKMRGLFRKLSRVVEKATGGSSEDRQTDSKGVRIASFEIALK